MSTFVNNDKIVSLDWNGAYFILTVRNEVTTTYNYLYSTDGQNWKTSKLPTSLTSSNPYVVKSVGDNYLIAGNVKSTAGSYIVNIIDGSNQNLILSPSGQIIYDIEKNLEFRNTITFPRNTLLALGGVAADSYKIAYSYDGGFTWSAASNSAAVFSVSANAAFWNGRIWVAGGSSGNGGNTLATSLDGNTWTGRGSFVFSQSVNGVQWSDQLQQFVAVGADASGNTIATSQDGIYWFSRSNPYFTVGNDVVWNGNVWVAVGAPVSNNTSIVYSTDGINWSTPPQGNLFSTSGVKVAWSGTTWIAVGNDASGNNVATSTDGINWDMIADASLVYPPTAVYADKYNTIICASGSSTQISVIPAGKTYDTSTIFTDQIVAPATVISDGTKYIFGGTTIKQYYGSSLFVDCPSFNQISVVKELITNNANKGIPTIQPITIACGAGNASLAYSYDGIQWVPIPNPLFSTAYKAAWNGVVWVAVGDPIGTASTYWAATSYDGVNWRGTDSSATKLTIARDVVWNGNVFVAVGANTSGGAMATSPDGLNWTSVAGISSIFSTSVNSIHWTGRVWLAYGSGTNTTAYSTTANGSVWNPTPVPNLAIQSGTNVTTGASYAYVASTNNGSASNAFDGSFTTLWTSASNYVGGLPVNAVGTSTTSGTINGEYVRVTPYTPVTVKYYTIAVSISDASAIPASWSFLGYNGTNWTPIHTYSFPANYSFGSWKYPQLVLQFDVSSNTTAYTDYQWVFTTTFGADYVSISDIQIFTGINDTLNAQIKPVVLKNAVLHPNSLVTYNATPYKLTDLSLNLISDGYINGAYVNQVIYGTGSGIITGSTFDGQNHVATTDSGAITYLSNTASLTNLNFDNSYNGVLMNSGLTAAYASCYNTQFILLGGSGASPITYNVMNNNPISTWYSTNTSDIFTTVYDIESNSRYGPVVCPNTLYLNPNDSLSLITPKFYNNKLAPETSISFNYKPVV